MHFLLDEHSDDMTSALNRAAFISRLCDTLQEESSSMHALIILDVDDFKQINDTLGHQEGDRALVTLVSRLRTALREQDIIGRIGGDEFMILVKDVTRESIRKRAAAICRQMYQQLSEDINFSVSLGISLYPDDGGGFDELYRCADTALYEAKRHGKNNYMLFSK